ncbi:MAG: Terminase-like family protein [Clostridiales bacterium]|nr:Terminase-like family protein [Clostridiales bacterium]
MSSVTIQSPNEKQKLFLTDQHKFVAFGGARGGGKSWAVRTKAKLLCLNYPGIKLLIIRKTYKELDNNHISPLRGELSGIATYNDSKKRFTFPQNRKGAFLGASTISFGYCASDADAEQYQGAEYDVIFIDEATNLDEMWIRKIIACCRGVNGFPKRVYYTCNPGGRSHHYIKRLFIDRNFHDTEDPDEYSFIQALVQDNTVLMKTQPDYVKQLEVLPPKLRDAWLYGRWDVFAGQFFEEFVDDPAHYADGVWTHVVDPLPLAKIRRMNIWRSYDWGYNKPFSCGWWGIDADGVVYRLLELYGCTESPDEGVKWTNDKQFKEMADIERQHPYLKGKKIQGVADPSIWDASHGESTAEAASRYGIYFEPGDNERIAGWMQMRYRLQFDGNGKPRMYIFNTCKAFIRTIPLLQYSETHPEDLDTKQEDHVADESRYFCMARPVKPLIQEEKRPPIYDPLGTLKENKRVTQFRI